jgi:hypothetical protein
MPQTNQIVRNIELGQTIQNLCDFLTGVLAAVIIVLNKTLVAPERYNIVNKCYNE